MERLLYNDEIGGFWHVDEIDLLGVRSTFEEPSDDDKYLSEFDELESRGWRTATSLTVAMALGEVCDEATLAAWVRKGSVEIETPQGLGASAHDLSSLLYEAVKQMAASSERVAVSVETIAAHAHLLSPPMTVEQVAAYAHIKPKTVYDWKSKGWIRPLADNAKPLLFDRDEVRRAVKRVRGIDS